MKRALTIGLVVGIVTMVALLMSGSSTICKGSRIDKFVCWWTTPPNRTIHVEVPGSELTPPLPPGAVGLRFSGVERGITPQHFFLLPKFKEAHFDQRRTLVFFNRVDDGDDFSPCSAFRQMGIPAEMVASAVSPYFALETRDSDTNSSPDRVKTRADDEFGGYLCNRTEKTVAGGRPCVDSSTGERIRYFWALWDNRGKCVAAFTHFTQVGGARPSEERHTPILHYLGTQALFRLDGRWLDDERRAAANTTTPPWLLFRVKCAGSVSPDPTTRIAPASVAFSSLTPREDEVARLMASYDGLQRLFVVDTELLCFERRIPNALVVVSGDTEAPHAPPTLTATAVTPGNPNSPAPPKMLFDALPAPLKHDAMHTVIYGMDVNYLKILVGLLVVIVAMSVVAWRLYQRNVSLDRSISAVKK